MRSNEVTASLAHWLVSRRIAGEPAPVLVLGTSCSIAAGAPTTDEIVKRIVDQIMAAEAKPPSDEALLAELIELTPSERSSLLRRASGGAPVPLFLHEAALLVRDGTFSGVVTTNLDVLFERALGYAGMRSNYDFDLVYAGGPLEATRRQIGRPALVKVVGDVVDGGGPLVRDMLDGAVVTVGLEAVGGAAADASVHAAMLLGGGDVWVAERDGLTTDVAEPLMVAREDVHIIDGESGTPDRLFAELLLLLVQVPTVNVVERPPDELGASVDSTSKLLQGRSGDLTAVVAHMGGTAAPVAAEFDRQLLMSRRQRAAELLHRLEPKVASGDAGAITARQADYLGRQIVALDGRLATADRGAGVGVLDVLDEVRSSAPARKDPEAAEYLDLLTAHVSAELDREQPNNAIISASLGAATILAKQVGVEHQLVDRLASFAPGGEALT
jgi:hypothetical protein